MGKFKTQWDSCAPLLHEIGEEDTAIPDLTYSITEMRRKFILEQELLKASAKQPQYLVPGVNDGENDPFENEDYASSVFDSPSVEVPRDNDLVDIFTLEDRVAAARERLPRLRAAKLAAEKVSVPAPAPATDPGSIAPAQSPTPQAQS
uniref:Uncharacterized protein n=1 Tax=Dulem virus 180 TaxID=3145657 RepID=A0AAU8B7P7_9VIRU